jgi:predicted amidohydrolase
MARRLTIAAVQMDATPAPRAIRLDRAQGLVERAAADGARLVVLPELFNIGYAYDDRNHARAEIVDGATLTWMRQIAARLGVHLAGSLLLLDGHEVYNALFLVAPNGREWRYDKNYPWGWERGYFRNGSGITVADTDLGRFGMLICWDTAHRDLWRHYAGLVDVMVISSCPPDVTNPTYAFPNGARLTIDRMGPLMASIQDSGRRLFGAMINEQTAWLGVPAVNTVGCGQITTAVPRGLAMVLAILPSAPWLVRYLRQAHRLQISCNFIQGCKIVDAEGRVLTEMEQAQGEGVTLAEVTLSAAPPQPRGAQPPSRVPAFAYVSSDAILPWLVGPIYRRGVR